MKNQYCILKLLLLSLLITNLAACNQLNTNKLDWMSADEKYLTLDSKFISTIKSGKWTPIQADPSDIDLFYLPDGKTMARFEFNGLVNSNDLERYLNGILNRLLKYSPVSGVRANVLLVGDNAYGKLQATPDGIIIVPLRFLKTSESEDEIAWLLAHELSHIILTHHDSDWIGRYHEKLNASLDNILDMTNNYIAMAKKFGTNSQSDELDRIAKIYKTSILLNDVANGSLFPAWQRGQEDEADLLAIDLCAQAGYSIDEADTILSKLEQWAENNDKKRKKLFDKFKTQFDDDLSYFKSPANFSAFQSFVDLTTVAMEKLAKVWKITANEVRYELNKTHRYVAERQKSILGYSDLFYKDIEVDPNFEKWEKQKAKRKNKSLFKAYNYAWLAQEELDLNGPDTALPFIRKAFKQDHRLNVQSYPRWIFYRVRDGQEKNSLASKNLSIALQSSTTAGKIFTLYITEQMEKSNYSKAKRVLNRAWNEFGKPPALYPFQIKVNKLTSNEIAAKKYFNECTKKAINKNTKKKCKKEFSG